MRTLRPGLLALLALLAVSPGLFSCSPGPTSSPPPAPTTAPAPPVTTTPDTTTPAVTATTKAALTATVAVPARTTTLAAPVHVVKVYTAPG